MTYFLGSKWNRLFRFFSFADQASRNWSCPPLSSPPEVDKLKKKRTFCLSQLLGNLNGTVTALKRWPLNRGQVYSEYGERILGI